MKFFYLLGIALSLSCASCSSEVSTVSAATNPSAALVAELPANPLQWRVITSEINNQDSTMSTLYGNDLAVEYARKHSQQDYPVGSEISLVTWTQRDDDRWFGARIPALVKSVEFVIVRGPTDGPHSYSYLVYEGASLTKVSAHEDAVPTDRAAYLLSQRAAVLP